MLGLAAAEEPVPTVVVRPEEALEARTSASVTVLPVDDTTAQSEDLATLVGRASGVAITRLGGLGDLATVSLRGSSARQVEVALDGIPLNPDGSGAVDLSELPLRAFDRVEIWRGNAPVGLGGTAMGGVVNLVTGDREVVDVAGLAGSFGTSRARGLVQRPVGRADLWASGQVLATAGDHRWYDDRGTRYDRTDDVERVRENNDTRTGSLQGRVRFGEQARVTVFDSFFVREEGVPGPTAAPSRAARYTAARNLAVLQVEHRGVRARLHQRARWARLLDPGREIGLVGGSSRTRTQSVQLDLLGQQAFGTWGTLTAAGTGGYDVRLAGGRRFVGRGQLGGTAEVGPLTLAPVVSAARIWSDGAGESTTTAVLPRLGALVRLGEVGVVKANVGRYYRPPGLSELFGNRGALAGRANLRPERGLNVDLGVRLQTDVASLELGGFASFSEDLIVYVQNAQRVSIPTNLGEARIFGAEAAFAWTGVPWLDWRTNLTVQRTENRSDEPAYAGRRLPRLPWLSVDQQTAWVHERWRVGHTFGLTEGMFLDPANLQRQPTRALHGLFVRHARGPWSVELDVRNLTGQRIANTPVNPYDPEGPVGPTAITDYVGYPLPGRSVWVSLGFSE